MKPNDIKTALFDTIQAMTDYKWFFSSRPGVDNIRNRKFPFPKMIADRGYESYNNLAHIQEKGWSFLIRIKDNTTGITSGLSLPNSDSITTLF